MAFRLQASNLLTRFGIPKIRRLLTYLLLGDFLFAILHVLHGTQPLFADHRFSIDHDLGFAEFYGYFKWIAILVFLVLINRRMKFIGYTFWILLFTYLLLDDALSVHESVGYFLTDTGMENIWGIKPQYIGSFGITAAVGATLAVVLFFAYRKGPDGFRKFCRAMGILFILLFLFGVVLDLLHSVLDMHGAAYAIFGMAEDGGELVVGGLMLAYVYSEYLLVETGHA